jgi:hypothetical protein
LATVPANTFSAEVCSASANACALAVASLTYMRMFHSAECYIYGIVQAEHPDALSQEHTGRQGDCRSAGIFPGVALGRLTGEPQHS